MSWRVMIFEVVEVSLVGWKVLIAKIPAKANVVTAIMKSPGSNSLRRKNCYRLKLHEVSDAASHSGGHSKKEGKQPSLDCWFPSNAKLIKLRVIFHLFAYLLIRIKQKVANALSQKSAARYQVWIKHFSSTLM